MPSSGFSVYCMHGMHRPAYEQSTHTYKIKNRNFFKATEGRNKRRRNSVRRSVRQWTTGPHLLVMEAQISQTSLCMWGGNCGIQQFFSCSCMLGEKKKTIDSNFHPLFKSILFQDKDRKASIWIPGFESLFHTYKLYAVGNISESATSTAQRQLQWHLL